MPRIPINSCSHNKENRHGCDNVMLTGEDAIEAMQEEDLIFDNDAFGEDDDDEERYYRDKYEQGECPDCLSAPCVCDQLHDMAVEDRLGGGDFDY